MESLLKVGLYTHGDLLFDVVTDPGETTNVLTQQPAIAQYLRQLIEEFNRTNPMPAPIRVTALPADAAGWEQLWRGVAEAGAMVLLGVGLLAWLGWRLVYRLRQRCGSPGAR